MDDTEIGGYTLVLCCIAEVLSSCRDNALSLSDGRFRIEGGGGSHRLYTYGVVYTEGGIPYLHDDGATSMILAGLSPEIRCLDV